MSQTGKRYRDVLLALSSAHNYGVGLGRLQMQKFIYLADSLSILWDLFGTEDNFQTYKHGPYDPAIQNAIDVLMFRGVIDIIRSEIKPDGTLIAVYKISDIGLAIAEKMKNEPYFLRRADLFDTIATHVAKRGWERLKELVYSDATYISRKVDGWGVPLNTSSLLSNDSLRTLLGFNYLVRNRDEKLSKENLTSLFFRVLDNYLSITQG